MRHILLAFHLGWVCSQDEEQIYRALEDLVTDDQVEYVQWLLGWLVLVGCLVCWLNYYSVQYADFYYKHLGGGNFGRRSSNYFAGNDKEEDIYEDLCSFSANKQVG